MKSFLDRDMNLLGTHTAFLDGSYLHIRVRNYGKGSKAILVDVMEITRHCTSMARALRIARDKATEVGITSKDCTTIRDNEIDQKATLYDGTIVVVHVRQTCFSFEAVCNKSEKPLDS